MNLEQMKAQAYNILRQINYLQQQLVQLEQEIIKAENAIAESADKKPE